MFKPARGFTLLEVMIALAVFAIAAMALQKTTSEQLSATARLKDKTFAHWVAMNRITELQVSNAFPEIGRGESQAQMAGREWKVLTTVEGSPVDGVRRIVVDVSEATDEFGEESPIVTSLTAYISQQPNAGGSL